jgi:hypothetical protein
MVLDLTELNALTVKLDGISKSVEVVTAVDLRRVEGGMRV